MTMTSVSVSGRERSAALLARRGIVVAEEGQWCWVMSRRRFVEAAEGSSTVVAAAVGTESIVLDVGFEVAANGTARVAGRGIGVIVMHMAHKNAASGVPDWCPFSVHTLSLSRLLLCDLSFDIQILHDRALLTLVVVVGLGGRRRERKREEKRNSYAARRRNKAKFSFPAAAASLFLA